VKALLLHPDRNFDPDADLVPNRQALRQDLELDILFKAMASEDGFLLETAETVVLSTATDVQTILYRQDVLRDCRAHASVVRNLYALAVDAIESEKRHVWHWADYSRVILPRAIDVTQMLVGYLRHLRAIADEQADGFKSKGFRDLFGLLVTELNDEYFAEVLAQLRELNFRDGVLISAELGKGNKGVNYVLRRDTAKTGRTGRMFGRTEPELTLTIDPSDEYGVRAVSELAEAGINLVANALAQSADHIIGFFRMLRTELAFYVGCLNLEERLAAKGEPLCFPMPVARGEQPLSFTELYDICLSLSMDSRAIGNTINADGKQLIVITGANQGGKSTFLRSVGLAQLMMQSGMFVAAQAFRASVCEGVFTHFNREEDTSMESGKLDEELNRMSDMVDRMSPGCMIVFNESFASTNEREGSEIASQIVTALLESEIRVLFVTHMFEFTRQFYEKQRADALFLKAEREDSGQRTFKLVESAPASASFGGDLYDRIFGAEARN
jgi:DNA mismatch repair ATPase MutS